MIETVGTALLDFCIVGLKWFVFLLTIRIIKLMIRARSIQIKNNFNSIHLLKWSTGMGVLAAILNFFSK